MIIQQNETATQIICIIKFYKRPKLEKKCFEVLRDFFFFDRLVEFW